MNVIFEPNKLNGKIKLISSKSFLHRMIICACFSKGKTILNNVTLCDDTKNTINILRQMFDIKIVKDSIEICGGIKNKKINYFEINESATTLRLLLPLLSYYSKQETTFKLGKRLFERGVDEYEELYKKSNQIISIANEEIKCNSFPIENYYSVSSEKSSQYASGLILLAATLDQDTTINIKNHKNSLSYVDLTIETLKMFGANIKRDGSNVFVMHNQKLSGGTFDVPSDASFALNIAVLNRFGSNIGLICPNFNKFDPDYSIYIDTLSTQFPKNEINLENNPDSLLPLALLASTMDCPVIFSGIKRLAYKESDRIQSLISFLLSINVNITNLDDNKLIVYPSKIKAKKVSSFNDHRFAFLGLILSTISEKEVTVFDFEYASKSYPNILTDFESLGLKYKTIENQEKIDYIFDKKITHIFASKNSLENLVKYKEKTYKKVLVYDSKINIDFVEKIKSHLGDNLYPYELSNKDDKNKSIKEVERFVHFLLENEVSKSDVIIAFGGGSVLDFVGFVSSIYKRGVKYIATPSTLLSMVDASIGGKNAIDFDGMKNMIGTYNNPAEIYVDFSILKTLPKNELKSGMAELIKIAALNDQNLFFDIYDSKPYEKLDEWVIKAIKNKIKFIEKDPFDEGERQALNFGHTYGHAIELDSKLSHGEAVAIGMSKESNNEFLMQTLLKYGFKLDFDIKEENLVHEIRNDKKTQNNTIKLVDLYQIGRYNFIYKKL